MLARRTNGFFGTTCRRTKGLVRKSAIRVSVSSCRVQLISGIMLKAAYVGVHAASLGIPTRIPVACIYELPFDLV